jgi:hypothetical protein
MIIDRPSRSAAGELLRHLVAGQITNAEFEERFPFSSDRTVREMWAAGWLLYDDFRTYRLVGSDRLQPADRKVIARCVLFLQTELRYEWPHSSSLYSFLNILTLGLTLDYTRQLQRKRFEKHGDIAVWPFVRQSDYDVALKNPRCLGRAIKPASV